MACDTPFPPVPARCGWESPPRIPVPCSRSWLTERAKRTCGPRVTARCADLRSSRSCRGWIAWRNAPRGSTPRCRSWMPCGLAGRANANLPCANCGRCSAFRRPCRCRFALCLSGSGRVDRHRSAKGFDQSGAPIAIDAPVWTTSSSAIATVDSRGVVTGVAIGLASIIATVGGIRGRSRCPSFRSRWRRWWWIHPPPVRRRVRLSGSPRRRWTRPATP